MFFNKLIFYKEIFNPAISKYPLFSPLFYFLICVLVFSRLLLIIHSLAAFRVQCICRLRWIAQLTPCSVSGRLVPPPSPTPWGVARPRRMILCDIFNYRRFPLINSHSLRGKIVGFANEIDGDIKEDWLIRSVYGL